MDKKFPPDHVFTGMLIAAVSITLCYIAIVQFAAWWEHALGHKAILQPPAPQLIILLIHIITFRQLVVVADRYATGSGYFMVLFAVTLWYFFTHSKELAAG